MQPEVKRAISRSKNKKTEETAKRKLEKESRKERKRGYDGDPKGHKAMRKILLAVAPVCHENVDVPDGVAVPYSPEEVAAEVIACARMGAGMVHLHVRDREGRQTSDLTWFSKTIDLIRSASDIIIQGSTGGVAELSLEDRCVSLNEPRVEVASLNMGSANLGDGVYINTLPDIEFWAQRMIDKNVVPEMEIFDLSMIDSVVKIANMGLADAPFSFNFCLGFENAINPKPEYLFALKQALPPNSHWGLIHENMRNQALLTTAAGMGASALRFGFEDSFWIGEDRLAKDNMQLLQNMLQWMRVLDMEPMSPAEARSMIGIQQ